ncbi:MAG: hypothetical protein ACYCUZ_05380 [Cuniculiplasma sp.]|jgi:hypothetical protein
MKVLKDGTIEACCEWAAEYLMNAEAIDLLLPVVQIETVQHDGDFYKVPLAHCPSCGAETYQEPRNEEGILMAKTVDNTIFWRMLTIRDLCIKNELPDKEFRNKVKAEVGKLLKEIGEVSE